MSNISVQEDDPPLYRVTDASVEVFRFHAPPTDPFTLGEIVVADDMAGQGTFFARVCGLATGMHVGGTGHPIEVTAAQLGYTTTGGEFCPPKRVPASDARVRRPGHGDLGFLEAMMGEIEIGTLRGAVRQEEPDNGGYGVRCGLAGAVLTRHVGVFATTGMGKSNLMKVFAASCMAMRKFGLLITDPHGEYLTGMGGALEKRTAGLLDLPSLVEGLAVFSTSIANIPQSVAFQPLHLSYADMEVSDLLLLYEFSPQVREVLDSILAFPAGEVIQFFIDEGVDSLPSQLKVTSHVGKNPDLVYALRAARFEPLRVVERRIRSLVAETERFLSPHLSSVPSIISALAEGKVVVIDIPGLSERSELLVLSVLARAVLHHHQETTYSGRINARSGHQTVIVMEEAQRVLGKGESHGAAVFRECAMEGRKFGVGLCLITQQPKDIDPRVLSQLNTLIIMGLADRLDREILAGNAKHDLSQMSAEIQTLTRGEAVISTIGVPFPISARVHLFESYIRRFEGSNRSVP
ncbi:MAG: ATP-binding protein [Methanomicrobiales archaeon]|nr:ATP-binding protein [Methanomicrobiales archaeon]